ncbi:COQ9 family protein [Sphingomonas zeae]
MTDVQDLTLDEVRAALADGIASNAAFDGWGEQARDMAADAAGVDRDIARLAFKDGPVAMIDAWFARIDQAMVEAVPADQAAAMKIRQRITALVEARLAAAAPNREALRRALAILAMPQNAASGARLGWRTVDAIWAQAGDTATDYNHYTKRATLFAVYASTIAVFLNDESEEYADTRAFLARRIEGIMRFEKWKAGVVKRGENMPSLSRFVGRLRYPAV